MDPRREALIRLGARLCHTCGGTQKVYDVRKKLVCYQCLLQENMDSERAHQKKMAEMEGLLALIESQRQSSPSYREACAEMLTDLGNALTWPFGGVF